ncbi:MAG: hypothetical protein ACK5MK_00480 [Dysgonomonas sp.]
MKSSKLAELEKDRKFKRLNFPLSYLYLNVLILAPVLVLFIGLLGILYLTKNDLLLSWYSIFYIVCFVLGTIWLKSISEIVIKKSINNPDAYLATWAAPIGEIGNKVYLIFTTGNKRHDKFYIENIRKKLSDDDCTELCSKANKKHAVSLTEQLMTDDDVLLTIQTKAIIKRRNPNWKSDESLPILYVDSKHMSPIAGRYLY